MSLSDCDECWQTPCVCGYEYGKNYWPVKRLEELIKVLEEAVRKKKSKNGSELSTKAKVISDAIERYPVTGNPNKKVEIWQLTVWDLVYATETRR